MGEGIISLDAGGPGYSLVITGVPVFGCRRCGIDLTIDEAYGVGINDIIVATVTALEKLNAVSRGDFLHHSLHC
ncbi:MAG: hypothetical protein ABIC40_08290, partial [bacterium]